MPNGLVSGYDSSSEAESDSENGSRTQTSTVNGERPIPSRAGLLATGMELPAPSSSTSRQDLKPSPPQSSHETSQKSRGSPASQSKAPAPRRYQIKIESLSGFIESKSGNESSEDPITAKKIKTGAGPSTSHSLFSMLPQPSRKLPPKNFEIDRPTEPRAQEKIDDTGSQRKGNADFRAMLGLAPQPKKSPGNVQIQATQQPGASHEVSPLGMNSKSLTPLRNSHQDAASPTPISSRNRETSDFFALPAGSSLSLARPTAEGDGNVNHSSGTCKFLSSAPELTEDYSGWQQNPDGTWFPVTPEAQASLTQHQSQQQHHVGSTSNYDGTIERLRQQGIAVADMESVELEGIKRHWQKRPMDTLSDSSSSLDAKYAQAAGEIRGAAPDGSDAEKKKRDKAASFRARQRGQLSSLFAQADEKRSELEERWAEGKAKRQAAASRYGFR